MSYADIRGRYVSDAVSTASPAALLIMLYDRLLLDLERGEALMIAGERNKASVELQHAQDIIMEFRMSLDVSSWEGVLASNRSTAFCIPSSSGPTPPATPPPSGP